VRVGEFRKPIFVKGEHSYGSYMENLGLDTSFLLGGVLDIGGGDHNINSKSC
jgi:hypothetical protein